jgi:hypothetical protein
MKRLRRHAGELHALFDDLLVPPCRIWKAALAV